MVSISIVLGLLIRENITPRGDGNFSENDYMSIVFNA